MSADLVLIGCAAPHLLFFPIVSFSIHLVWGSRRLSGLGQRLSLDQSNHVMERVADTNFQLDPWS